MVGWGRSRARFGWIGLFSFSFCLGLLLFSRPLQAAEEGHVLVFYAPTGGGHVAATRAIEAAVREYDQTHGTKTVVVPIDILRYSKTPIVRRYGPTLWSKVRRHLAGLDVWYWRKRMEDVDRLDDPKRIVRPAVLNLEAMADEITAYRPRAILSTVLNATEALVSIREQGLLSKAIPTAWVMTDFTDNHPYLMKLSNRLDKTFLPHHAMLQNYLQHGLVQKDRLAVSGMPIAKASTTPLSDEQKQEVFKRLDLDPSVPTVLITPGKEGWLRFSEYVETLRWRSQNQLQVIAVCGTNQAEYDRLNKFFPVSGEETFRVRTVHVASRTQMTEFMAISDIIAVKPGGLTPVEAIHSDKPLILLPPVGGNEYDNVAFLTRLGVARVGDTPDRAAESILSLLKDPEALEKMSKAQAVFREQQNMGRVLEFLEDSSENWEQIRRNYTENDRPLGLTHGIEVSGAGAALSQLDAEAPADVEIFLAHSTGTSESAVSHWAENPFGHIAIRIGDKVYNVNHLAASGSTDPLLVDMDLERFLYGVQPKYASEWVGHTFGLANETNLDSIRIKNVSPEMLRAMVERVADINRRWQGSEILYHIKAYNCADVVHEILSPWLEGLGVGWAKAKFAAMPRDLFMHLGESFQASGLALSRIRYNRIEGSRSFRRFSRPPLAVQGFLEGFNRMVADLVGFEVAAPLPITPDWQVSTPRTAKGRPQVTLSPPQSASCEAQIRSLAESA